jgi:hypothetical protein
MMPTSVNQKLGGKMPAEETSSGPVTGAATSPEPNLHTPKLTLPLQGCSPQGQKPWRRAGFATLIVGQLADGCSTAVESSPLRSTPCSRRGRAEEHPWLTTMQPRNRPD